MQTFGEIIHTQREKRSLLLRHVAASIDVDQALISKFERGDRIPTKEQVIRLARLYELDENELISAWLADKIVFEMRDEKMALQAMKRAEQLIKKTKTEK